MKEDIIQQISNLTSNMDEYEITDFIFNMLCATNYGKVSMVEKVHIKDEKWWDITLEKTN